MLQRSDQVLQFSLSTSVHPRFASLFLRGYSGWTIAISVDLFGWYILEHAGVLLEIFVLLCLGLQCVESLSVEIGSLDHVRLLFTLARVIATDAGVFGIGDILSPISEKK